MPDASQSMLVQTERRNGETGTHGYFRAEHLSWIGVQKPWQDISS
jgi:hypothetical protein